MSKITVIGAGKVGAAITNNLMIQGIASEILMVDINEEKAFGEALDIYQGATLCTPCKVHSGSYADAWGSDIVVITSGIARKPGQTRLELAQVNTEMLKEIAPRIAPVCPNAIYIIITNPVDVLTYVFQKLTGLPEKQVIGSGTILDTCRLTATLAEKFDVSPECIEARVYGEHGDSGFIPWSKVRIADNTVEEYLEISQEAREIPWNPEVVREIETFVKNSGAMIIKAKGATFYAIAQCVCYICRVIMHGRGTAMCVSSMMHGEYGVSDVCLSTMVILDHTGIRGRVHVELTNEEIEKLRASAKALRASIDTLDL